ncbi:Vesicle coat complex AP-1, gamma subunit [Phaffia rhodozyma]|uniref:Vesicle coat complex AP-1, gamma subunit n=1 Tax=Phaffia rhodozyma TaxID=264483 RepID=A0A0F7SFR9_PHARH|nr:Vesicle coat complex AP-1, gamma subunit [Phaffia rhodozyma]
MNTSYLLSSALSPAHYAFVHKIEQASSIHQLDLICRNEIDTIRNKVTQRKKPLRETSARECLIFMLYIATVQPLATDSTRKNLDFASILALNLAEGGKPASVRRAGYLYLNLTLRPTDDFSLLLFNTIFKDLRSSHVPTIALALNSIIQNPSKDIVPAIQTQLVHLVSHKSSDIRRLSLCALTSLSKDSPDVLMGLKERKIWKRLEDKDTGVALHAVRALRRMIEFSLVSEYVAIGALMKCLAANVDRCSTGLSPSVQLEVIQTLALLSFENFGTQGDDLVKLLSTSIEASSSQAHRQTLILQICLLLLQLPESFSSSLMQLPATSQSSFFQSIQSALHSSQPNEYIFALRCLEALSGHISVWEGSLNEGGMEQIMNGLNSTDELARKLTLKILSRLSPSLPELHLDRIIASFPTSKSYSNLEILKTRSLEVLEILVGVPLTRSDDGTRTARLLWSILEGKSDAHKPMNKDDKDRDRVLESIVGRVLNIISNAGTEAQNAFLGAFFAKSSETTPKSLTTQMILAVLACEYTQGFSKELSASLPSDVLMACLKETSDEPVKEALLISLLGLCVKSDVLSGQAVTDIRGAVEELGSRSGNHLKKRCETFLRIASSEKSFRGMRSLLESGYQLPSILSASRKYISSLPALSSSSSSPKPFSESSSRKLHEPPRDLSTSELKYGPYPTAKDPKVEKSKRKQRDQSSVMWREDMDQTITIERDDVNSRYASRSYNSESSESDSLGKTLVLHTYNRRFPSEEEVDEDNLDGNMLDLLEQSPFISSPVHDFST